MLGCPTAGRGLGFRSHALMSREGRAARGRTSQRQPRIYSVTPVSQSLQTNLTGWGLGSFRAGTLSRVEWVLRLPSPSRRPRLHVSAIRLFPGYIRL